MEEEAVELGGLLVGLESQEGGVVVLFGVGVPREVMRSTSMLGWEEELALLLWVEEAGSTVLRLVRASGVWVESVLGTCGGIGIGASWDRLVLSGGRGGGMLSLLACGVACLNNLSTGLCSASSTGIVPAG